MAIDYAVATAARLMTMTRSIARLDLQPVELNVRNVRWFGREYKIHSVRRVFNHLDVYACGVINRILRKDGSWFVNQLLFE